MAINWSKCLGQPQTYVLLGGTALGYAALLWLVGPRPLVWLGGGSISAAMVGNWVAGFRRSPAVALGSDLLDPETLAYQLEPLGQRVPPAGQKIWRQAQTWAMESQRFAVRIYDRDPLLQVELLEAMHTVMDLAQQVADGLAVMDQIETPAYRQLAQQRLTASCDRLQVTHAQLQQLQDQVTLASLETGSTAASPLPQRLQTLIAANKHILESNPPPP
ncbi:MAG TPA: hypothetical protein IGR64_01370 [Leptolyngbyaceae cyanobacterium M65_K2018_010]|nr:hypothetical protein [Leptolyngbyaceae cyanobacterium M65_K2018_010]